ncbi:septum formation initiator, partial [Streptomyces kronopolitis]
MTIRILSAIGDPDAARAVSSLLHQLPDAEPAPAVADSTALLAALARAGAQGAEAPAAAGPAAVEGLPEVVLVHERIGPAPALELI